MGGLLKEHHAQIAVYGDFNSADILGGTEPKRIKFRKGKDEGFGFHAVYLQLPGVVPFDGGHYAREIFTVNTFFHLKIDCVRSGRVCIVAAYKHEEQEMNIKKSVNIATAKAGITKRDLAALMGVSPSTLSGVLSRNVPTGDTLEKMARALGMKVSELIALGE